MSLVSMFLLVLNEPQARSVLARPWAILSVGIGVLAVAVLFGGASPFLVPALVLPIFEFRLARSPLRTRKYGIALAAAAVLIAHATFLAFMQLGAVGTQRLAVNFAYTSAILVGASIGLLLFGLPLAETASGARKHGGT